MVTNKERIDAETQKRKLRDDKEYNKKVAALFEDEKKEQVKEHNRLHAGKVPGTETITIYPKKKKQK